MKYQHMSQQAVGPHKHVYKLQSYSNKHWQFNEMVTVTYIDSTMKQYMYMYEVAQCTHGQQSTCTWCTEVE